MVPSPPKTRSRSTARAKAAASAHTAARKPASSAVMVSLYSPRPAAVTRRAACLTAPAQETFSEFPIKPTRLILSANLFNQHQEFFVACRTQERRLRDAAPRQARLFSYEFIQLAPHPLVDRRSPDHSRSPAGRL